MSGELYKGDVHIDALDDNFLPTGYSGDINATSLAIETQDPEEKIRVGTGENTNGQALDTIYIPKPQKITLTFDELTPELRALAMGGSVVDWTQGSVTDEPITVTVKLDKWMELGYRNIAAGGVNHATMVEDTDYIVDPVKGLVKFLSTGAATADASESLTVTANAIAAQRVKGGTRPTFNARILLSGVNQTNGKRGTLTIFRAALAPSGSVDPKSGEFLSVTFKGTLVTPPDGDAPYYWDGPETLS